MLAVEHQSADHETDKALQHNICTTVVRPFSSVKMANSRLFSSGVPESRM